MKLQVHLWLGSEHAQETDSIYNSQSSNRLSSNGPSYPSIVGSFLKDPWIVLGDTCPDFSHKNMILYVFITSYMIFIQNEHVKLNETYLDTQGHFKEELSNVTDVLWGLPPNLVKLKPLPKYTIITHLSALKPH